MFLKEFEIRWNDLDANKHLANVSYLAYAGETRMAFLQSMGISYQTLIELGIGPIVFYEHLYYFKEALPGQNIRVSVSLAGMSKGGTFFEFEHNYYDEKGTNLARCEMMGAWMNLKSRKLAELPPTLLSQFQEVNKSVNYKELTTKDTRKWNKIPKDLKL